MTSETKMAYGSRVLRQGRSRPLSAYQPRGPPCMGRAYPSALKPLSGPSTPVDPRVVGQGWDGDLPGRAPLAVLGVRREHDDKTEVVGRRPAQLLDEHVDELGRPEELALEVDEPLRASQGPQIALEDAEIAARQPLVDVVRDRAHDLELGLPRGFRRRAGIELLAGHLLPPQREVRGHVADGWALQPRGRVVPAEPPAGRMRGRVEPVAAESRQVDPADEGDPPVDDHKLLVVAMEGPLAVVERA